ncbi:hypothetical protein [Nocardia fluminea]|uniref:Uncharacterized protein n=1 Tax=Nocardia fluminea TaxID=134984 RepID=A0A2N3VH28_9NOCA|nr:hypothetical protein [Nocardia fluminea]PKV80914.1 hypothetical protein ATK86_5351 [Nocardia fluminea]
MTTQRKAPVRKALAPRKTTEQKITAFDELRARAGDRRLGGPSNVAPFEIPGFQPPLIVQWPTSIVERVTLDITNRNADVPGFLYALLGGERLALVLAAVNGQPDPDRLLIGLQLRISDHFLGAGAGDVPGGSPASSTS